MLLDEVESMESGNPFSVTFGEKPREFIQRSEEFNEILSTFNPSKPISKTLIITGARGVGKTVLLAQTRKYFEEKEDWITVDLNPFMDMLEEFASKLYDRGQLKKLFLSHEFNFSFHGLSFSISGNKPITNVNSLLETMLKYLKGKAKKVLICIDDVAPNEHLKKFIYTFQSFLRDEYEVFLLMTGLFENISELQNDNNLTFLLRATKITLKSLNLRAITFSYEDTLDLDKDEAIKLAKITNGYAYGYQLLGNLMYKSKTRKVNKKILSEYDLLLEDNVYAKVWSTLSNKEKEICFAISKTNKTKEIMELSKVNNSSLQVYKKRLSNRGVIDISSRGFIAFALPRFKEFVQFQESLLD